VLEGKGLYVMQWHRDDTGSSVCPHACTILVSQLIHCMTTQAVSIP